MIEQNQNLPFLVQHIFNEPDFAQTVIHVLDWVPEIKHESLVCTILSANLRKQGINSRREVASQKRRIDLLVESRPIEAKYHYEFDLLGVMKSFCTDEPKKGTRRSASDDIHTELSRGQSSYFLWLICVRSNQNHSIYKYPGCLKWFYDETSVSDLQSAVNAAKNIVDNHLFPTFQQRSQSQVSVHSLPDLRGIHSTLISRLYIFE